MTPYLSLEVILSITIGSIILIGLYIICYCVCNRTDFERSPIRNEGRNRHYNYTTLCDDKPESRQCQVEPPSCILTGLENIDRECYMNSILQALASSKQIMNQLNEAKSTIPFSESLRIILELIENLNSESKYRSVENNTSLLKALVKEIKWEKKSEQDAFEFLTAIVNTIHKEMKDAKVEMISPLKCELKHKISGLDIPDKIQEHLGLSLGLCGLYKTLPGVHLDYLINQYFSSTNIDNNSSQTAQLFFFRQIPDVLVLHIQANKWDVASQQMIKPIYYIKYDEYLHLNLKVMMELHSDKMTNENVNYKLMAVINHMGNYSSGHYMTYRKYEENWILANDEQIEFVPFDFTICPYILIYEKC